MKGIGLDFSVDEDYR